MTVDSCVAEPKKYADARFDDLDLNARLMQGHSGSVEAKNNQRGIISATKQAIRI